MREERRRLLPLVAIAAIVLLAVLSLVFGSLCYGGFSGSYTAPIVSVADTEVNPSFGCTSISYSGDYASAPAVNYTKVVFDGKDVVNVPAGLDIKLDEGGYVVYSVYDESGSLLGTITTSDNKELVVSSKSILDCTGALTLHVQFEYLTYSVSYVLNAPTGVNVVNPNPTAFTFESAPTLNAPQCAGYEFLGWFRMNESKEEQVSAFRASIFDADRNLELHAKWRAMQFSLQLYKEDKVTLIGQYSIEVGAPLASELPSSPEVGEGRRFIGWYTFSDVKLADNAVMSASDLKLYARTEEIAPTATVSFSFEYEDGDTSVAHKSPVDIDVDLKGGFAFTVGQLVGKISASVEGHDYTVKSAGGEELNLEDTVTLTDGALMEFTVSYTRRSYTVTVNYLYVYDRSTAASAKQTVLKYGDSADIVSPAIEAFAPNKLAVSVTKIKSNQVFTVTYVTTENFKKVELPDGSVVIVTNDDGGLVGAELTVTSADKGGLKEMSSKLKSQGILAEAGAQYSVSLSKGKFGYRGTYTVKVRLLSGAADMINPTLFKDKEGALVQYDADFGDSSIAFRVSADDMKAGGISVLMSGIKPTSIGVFIGIGVAALVVVLLIILLILWLVLWTKKKVKFEVGGGEAIDTVVVKRGEIITVPTPCKEGAEFVGWFKDKAFKKPVEFLSESVVRAEIDDTPYVGDKTADGAEQVKDESAEQVKGESADGNISYESAPNQEHDEALATDVAADDKAAVGDKDGAAETEQSATAADELIASDIRRLKVRGNITLYAKWQGDEVEEPTAEEVKPEETKSEPQEQGDGTSDKVEGETADTAAASEADALHKGDNAEQADDVAAEEDGKSGNA